MVGADLAARGVQEDVPFEYESVYGRAATAMPIGIKAPLYHEAGQKVAYLLDT